MTEWIKASDRMPKSKEDGTGVYVLTLDKYKKMVVAVYSPEDKCWYNADDVTHWMPLPEKPPS